MGSRYLPIYLNDHLAAATAGSELAKRIRGATEGEPLGELMERLTPEIEADREALREFMRSVGADEDKVKVFVGFSGEKLGRFKLNGHLLSPSPLSRLTELDGLCLILDGRRSLWRTLAETGHAGADLAELELRAAAQREALEPFRLEAARSSLIDGS
jgi:hypothetical protein